MKALSSPLGIFGGTFDPIHKGHLYAAHCVWQQTPIKKIYLLPCYQPVHRATPHATAEQRSTMIQLAIEETPYLKLDTQEIKRRGASYTIDTLIHFREHHPFSSLVLILGSDAYQQITCWNRWQALLDYAHFVILHRTGTPLSHSVDYLAKRETQDAEELIKDQSGKIFFIAQCFNPISATLVREKITKDESISSLVPRKVAIYIEKNHLYKID
jgi:nicotinate-nucleotide adenylyltransferase